MNVSTVFFFSPIDYQISGYKKLLTRDLCLLKEDSKDKEQKSEYKNCETDWNSASSTRQHIIPLYHALKKLCNHPYLCEEFRPAATEEFDEKMITDSGKMQVLDKLLQRFKKDGHRYILFIFFLSGHKMLLFWYNYRVLIFSVSTLMLTLLEGYCKHRGWKCARLHGTTNRLRRCKFFICF